MRSGNPPAPSPCIEASDTRPTTSAKQALRIFPKAKSSLLNKNGAMPTRALRHLFSLYFQNIKSQGADVTFRPTIYFPKNQTFTRKSRAKGA